MPFYQRPFEYNHAFPFAERPGGKKSKTDIASLHKNIKFCFHFT